MSLYLDPHFVDWMNDSILQRILVALRDRIPIKLREQGEANRKKKTGQQKKSIVDVYRGSNYQIAYYFRKNTQNHSVLLKDKQLLFTHPDPPARSASPDLPPPPPFHSHSSNNKRARSTSQSATPAPLDLDLTDEADGDSDVRAGKRRAVDDFDEDAGAPLVDHPAEVLLRVKDEPLDEEMPPPQSTSRVSQSGGAPLFEPEEELGHSETTSPRQNQVEEDVKPREYTAEDFEGQKPELKVSYTGYSIFGYTLVVIVEPYPALHPSAFAIRPSIGPVEIRQLSSSVQPEGSRSRLSTATASATPAPQSGAKRSQEPLFRSVTTPLEDERTRSESRGVGDSEAGDVELDRFRESSQALANGWDGNASEEEEELPTLEDLAAEGAGSSRR